jgi:hypothetical protein
MQEVCCRYCGRRAEVDDRDPIWLEGRRLVFEAAVRRWLAKIEERVQPRPEPTGVA